jgi:leucyl-tRNA synthetase
MSERYNVQETEKKWQNIWEEKKSFRAETILRGPILHAFPCSPTFRPHSYGHVRNYTLGDVVARYKRAQGFNVLHPMGWTLSAFRLKMRRRKTKSIRRMDLWHI